MTATDEAPRARPARWNPASAMLSVIGVWALIGLPFLRVAPNRMLSGEPVYFWDAMQSPAGAVTDRKIVV